MRVCSTDSDDLNEININIQYKYSHRELSNIFLAMELGISSSADAERTSRNRVQKLQTGNFR